MQEKEAQITEFNQFNQFEIVKDYNDKFLTNIEQMYKDNSYELFKSFFFAMLPREYEIHQSDIDKLIKVKQDHIAKTGKDDNNDAFIKIIMDGIDLLSRSKKIRELALA